MPPSSADLFPRNVPEDPTSPAQSGWVTAHCDGGARGNPGPAGYGALLQDEAGVVLAELSEFLGNRTNNYAEYSGLLGCLQWALDHGHRRLRVVSDSELMVKQIQGKYKVNSPDLRPLWEEARRRIAHLERFEISHALRHKNKAADRLANEAMDRGAMDRGAMDRGAMDRGAMDRGAKRPAAAGESRQRLEVAPGPARSSASTSSASPRSASPAGVREHQSQPETSKPTQQMLRGFTRNGAIHLLGGTTLPDGIFVKIIPE